MRQQNRVAANIYKHPPELGIGSSAPKAHACKHEMIKW